MNIPQPLEKVFCNRNRRSIQTKFFYIFVDRQKLTTLKDTAALIFQPVTIGQKLSIILNWTELKNSRKKLMNSKSL